MRRLTIILTGLLVILSVSGLAAQDNATVPLQVIDTSPLSSEELGLHDAISLFFDRPLNCATASTAVTITPAVETTTDCEGSTLTITPSTGFQTATTYTLTVGTSLLGDDRAALAEPFTLQLNSIGDLAVSEVLPNDGTTGIETNAVITAIFNRPVVPLQSNEDLSTLPDPLSFDPALPGKGEWLNTAIYLFHPDPALAGGTQYTVTVNAGLHAVDGALLSQPYSWTFTTVEPAVVEVTPEDQASDVVLDELVQVTFNQAMDHASVEASFYLRPEGQQTGRIAGTFEWSDDDTVMHFIPDGNLALDTMFHAGFEGSGPFASNGTTPLTPFREWSFVTVPAPAIIGTDPFQGQEDVNLFTSFRIYFASPMNQATLRDKITIDPAPLRKTDDYYFDFDNSFNISFPQEPSTTYTITVAPGMEDIYGNRIERGRTFTYTAAPFDPDVTLQAPYGIGFYNAYNDQTQVYVTHRNVSRLDLQLYQVPRQAFINALVNNSYDPSQDYHASAADLLADWSI